MDVCDAPNRRSATTGSAWLATLPDVAAGAAVNPSGRREELLEAGDGAITVTLSPEGSPSSWKRELTTCPRINIGERWC